MSFKEDRELVSRLKKAVGSSDLQTVQRLIKGGVDVNKRFWYGSTLLLEAVTVGCLPIVQALIKAQADVTAGNEDGRTPLHIASRAGFTDIVCVLLKAGSDVDALTWDGETCLHLAVWRGRDAVIETLLGARAKVNVQSKEGYTPLRWAAKLGALHAAKLLVKYGAAINYKTINGETPLYEALARSQNEMARFLILEGADVNLGSQKASFPHMVANCMNTSTCPFNLLEMLTTAGYNIHKDTTLKRSKIPLNFKHTNDQAMYEKWLQTSLETVPSLMCLCRTRIRRRISYCIQGQSICHRLECLIVPQILTDFMLFKGEIENTELSGLMHD